MQRVYAGDIWFAGECLRAARRDEDTDEAEVGAALESEFMLRVIHFLKG